mmetsp:Transcript_3980/g.7615  ORF Transcript_3980/g.7615 Transcript_3980/m.7615 type:complete len:235 (-) Transcript_3980:575-1279(-)
MITCPETLSASPASKVGETIGEDMVEGEKKANGLLTNDFDVRKVTTDLERNLLKTVKEQKLIIAKLNAELTKLRNFIAKRKQTYKRKRKSGDVPTRPLSAYNIFVKERFSKLASENEHALQSTDADAKLKRVPPATLVASTGTQWKDLSEEKKESYKAIADVDRKRYEAQMSEYTNRKSKDSSIPIKPKRSKTGYNLFFSEFVKELKESNQGEDSPAERGKMARLVGQAWKVRK